MELEVRQNSQDVTYLNAFGPAELDKLEQIFNAAWAEVASRYPDRDKSRDAQLQTVAMRSLIATAAVQGLADPRTLHDEAIKSLG
jgi:hypothetical protein